MKNDNQSSHLASLYNERNVLLEQMVHLQNQIVNCDSKLVALLLSKQYRSSQEDVKALHDEIFGCRVEIQSLRVHINRLKAKISPPQQTPDEQNTCLA